MKWNIHYNLKTFVFFYFQYKPENGCKDNQFIELVAEIQGIDRTEIIY